MNNSEFSGMLKKYWNKIEAILDEVIGLSASDQKKQIEILCGNNHQVRSQVIQLVNSIQESDKFVENISESKMKIRKSLLNNLEEEKYNHLLNRQIGRYKIIKQIGSGGMGSVFLAERSDGVFEKKAAVKILKKEFNYSAIKSQFKQERQILANLNHHSIAKIYDGGLIEDMPYFVMEYVDGIPIDQYCDSKALSIQKRLQFFKTVCKTVQYAHNNLVIHRDLKPQNILVNKHGQLKILDFGVATIQSKQLSNQAEGFLTPSYAAPEQLSNNKITTATDIYALGVLLYQLLSGCKPFDLTNKTIKEMIEIKLNIIKPSLRFSKLPENEKIEIARKRSTTPQKLSKILSGELDQIVKKTLSPNVDERYPSANSLKQDISNYENKFPIHACNQTFVYRTNKFIRRNYKELSVALVMICTIVGLLLFYFKNIETERNIAIHETEKAEEITDFMIGLFEMNDPAQNPGNHLTAKDLLYIGLEKTENLTDNELQAGILTVMGNALTNLSDFEKADEVLESAVQKNRTIHGELDISTADAIYALGNNHSKNMMWELALPYFEKAHEIYSKLLDPNHFKVVNSLSKLTIAMWNTGNEETAIELSERAYNLVSRGEALRSPELLELVSDYGYHLVNKKDYEKAENIFLQVIDTYVEIGGEGDSRLATQYNRLATLYRIQENYLNAENYFRKALDISTHTMGEDHRFTRMVRMNLVTPLLHLGKHEEIEYHFQNNIEITEGRFGPDHWRTGSAYGAYGVYLVNQGNYEKAEELFRKNLGIYQKAIGEDHVWTAYVYGALAACYRFLGEHELARQYYERHLPIYEERAPDFNNDHVSQIRRLIRMYEQSGGDYNEYINWYSTLLE